jgi:hypothetical protein
MSLTKLLVIFASYSLPIWPLFSNNGFLLVFINPVQQKIVADGFLDYL